MKRELCIKISSFKYFNKHKRRLSKGMVTPPVIFKNRLDSFKNATMKSGYVFKKEEYKPLHLWNKSEVIHKYNKRGHTEMFSK